VAVPTPDVKNEGTPAMHAYERWTIRRYLANALKSTRFFRPPSPDSEIFPWIDAHARLLGLPNFASGTRVSKTKVGQ
jgi:hypothetical protein